jgi:hypothetical protein
MTSRTDLARGPLRADGSRGTSGVFINGRQLTLGEKSYLEQTCRTPAAAGRYWVNAQGVGWLRGSPGVLQPGVVRERERAEPRRRFEHADILQPGRFLHVFRLVGLGADRAEVMADPEG